MPGIVGLITKIAPELAKAQLDRMVHALCHDSAYESGMWADATMGFYIGWAARKGSLGSGMPLSNERGDAILIFSGDEYPGTSAPKSHQGGHPPASSSYLLQSLEHDSSFPSSLNGRFQGFQVCRNSGEGALFNDRFGLNRIYYHQSQDAFYFSAEAKAILAVRPNCAPSTHRDWENWFLADACWKIERCFRKSDCCRRLPDGRSVRERCKRRPRIFNPANGRTNRRSILRLTTRSSVRPSPRCCPDILAARRRWGCR